MELRFEAKDRKEDKSFTYELIISGRQVCQITAVICGALVLTAAIRRLGKDS